MYLPNTSVKIYRSIVANIYAFLKKIQISKQKNIKQQINCYISTFYKHFASLLQIKSNRKTPECP
jgi:hypothetical protein